MKTFIIAEAGINHNGDLEIAKKLIKGAKEAGADAIKFQKRNIDKVYTQDILNSHRESPWGTTQRDQKAGLEFDKLEYDVINAYCKINDIEWFASPWDLDSVEFLKQYDCRCNKIASPMLFHKELLEAVAKQKKYTYISTGMCTLEELDDIVTIFDQNDCPFELMHCNSQYPMPDEKANLKMIYTLQERYDCAVGYSGHEVGLITSCAAVAIGASSIERHITLDRAMYGSDQSSSIELSGFKRMVDYIRTIESALGSGQKIVTEDELKAKGKLARTQDIV